MKKLLLPFILVAVLIACNDEESNQEVLSIVVDVENITEIPKMIEEKGSLPEEEMAYLVQGLQRIGFVKDSLVGKSLADIIEAEKNFRIQKNKNKIKKISTQIAMRMNHSFQFEQLGKVDNDTLKSNLIKYSIINPSGKAITYVKGIVEFYETGSNTIVNSFPIELKQTIPPYKKLTNKAQFYHDPNKRSDQLLRNKKLRFNVIWHAAEIHFDDGTQLKNYN